MRVQHDPNAVTITKADVPGCLRPTGQLIQCTFLGAVLAAGYLYADLWPGVVELCIAVVFGTLLGFLTAPPYIAMAKRSAAIRAQHGELEWWDSRWIRDAGSTLLMVALAVVVCLALVKVDYLAWTKSPELSMPWARFAYSTLWRAPGAPPSDRGCPLDSMAAAALTAAFLAQVVLSTLFTLWYNRLPPRPTVSGEPVDGFGRDA